MVEKMSVGSVELAVSVGITCTRNPAFGGGQGLAWLALLEMI